MAIRLVAFDLDGTLVRGETCVQAIGRAIGRDYECTAFEQVAMRDRGDVTAAREQMAVWVGGREAHALCSQLGSLPLAPGAEEGFALLRKHRLETAVVSMTWRFAVDWFVARLGADYAAGTHLAGDGSIRHFWPENKGVWLDQLRGRLGLARDEVAAVGDSGGDRELMEAAGMTFFVGSGRPPIEVGFHLPDGNIAEIARLIVGG